MRTTMKAVRKSRTINVRCDEKKGSLMEHIISITEKYDYTVISGHHSCGKTPRGACFFSPVGILSVNRMLQPACLVEVSSGAFTGLVGIELFLLCSSRVAGSLNYLPVDYGLHAACYSWGIFHLDPTDQVFFSFSKKKVKKKEKKVQLICLFIAAVVVRK